MGQRLRLYIRVESNGALFEVCLQTCCTHFSSQAGLLEPSETCSFGRLRAVERTSAAYSLSVSSRANRPNGGPDWNDPPPVIKVADGALPARLAPFENMVLDLTLDDGTNQSGVLVTLDESWF